MEDGTNYDNTVVNTDGSNDLNKFTSHLNDLSAKVSEVTVELCSSLGKTCINDICSNDIKTCNKLNKAYLAETLLTLIRISDNISDSDAPNMSDLSVNKLNNISETMSKNVTKLEQFNIKVSSSETEFTKLTEKIENLQSSVDKLVSSGVPPTPHQTPPPPNKPASKPLDPEHNETQYDKHKTNYLSDDHVKELDEFLKKCRQDKMFSDEKGHSVLLFGEKYKYTGSKTAPNPPPIPKVIGDIKYVKIRTMMEIMY